MAADAVAESAGRRVAAEVAATGKPAADARAAAGSYRVPESVAGMELAGRLTGGTDDSAAV